MSEIKRDITEIVAELDAWRKEKNLSQKDLAEMLKVGQPTVSRLLRGQLPSAQSFHSLCITAGISVHKTVDPWSSPIITAAVRDAWDGSEEGARAIVMLLVAARHLSARSISS